MKHLVSLLFVLTSPFASAKAPADEYFKVDTIAGDFVDAMEIAVTPDGHVFVIQRTGAVKLVNPKDGEVKVIATIPVEVRKKEFARECGLLGITLDPNYRTNKWVYLYYSVQGKPVHHLARFTFKGGRLNAEKTLLEVPHDRENSTCHEGGSLAFGPDGCLYLSTGDNTCPFQSNGSAPIDEGKNRKW